MAQGSLAGSAAVRELIIMLGGENGSQTTEHQVREKNRGRKLFSIDLAESLPLPEPCCDTFCRQVSSGPASLGRPLSIPLQRETDDRFPDALHD